jgi:uncharacterized protein (DUF2062 family)
MPRRFFRKFTVKRHQFRERWFLSPFRHLMHDHRLWSIRRKNVVPAVALGTFFAFLPFPGHPVWASFGALAMRINVPVAALTTFISNPLTMAPMYYLACRFGAWILGVELEPFDIEMSIDWVTHTFVNIWQPMLLGCLLLGSAAALIAYVGLDLIWRVSIGNYKNRKRRQRTDNDL